MQALEWTRSGFETIINMTCMHAQGIASYLANTIIIHFPQIAIYSPSITACHIFFSQSYSYLTNNHLSRVCIWVWGVPIAIKVCIHSYLYMHEVAEKIKECMDEWFITKLNIHVTVPCPHQCMFAHITHIALDTPWHNLFPCMCIHTHAHTQE